MSLYSLPRPSGFRATPSSLLVMDSRSPALLQGTAPGTEGIQQAFPATAVDLITALGATGVILPANVLAIYQCDTASPLVDSLGLGPNLVAAGAPLTGRECVGLPGTSFTSKVGVEFLAEGAGVFNGGNAFGNVAAGNIFSFLIVLRWNTNAVIGNRRFLSKEVGALWTISCHTATELILYSGAGFACSSTITYPYYDGAWHNLAGVFDCAAPALGFFSDMGNGVVAGPPPASIVNAASFLLGAGTVVTNPIQVAYLACFDRALTSAMRANFWRAFNPNGLGTDPTYTRANPLVTRITNVFGNVACYGANQPAIGYAPNASAGDNALKTAVVCEDGATFLGLGSDNMPAFVGTNATVTAADGPSGMRDACRVADTDGVNAGYATSGAAVLAGATNVPFIYSAYVKSGGVGTNAVYQSYYTGDAGGPETFTNWTIVGALQPVWRPFIGLTHTPVGAAHTAVVTRLIPTDNVGASLGTVDFAEVWGVQNSAVDRLAWRRVATGAGAATGTAALSYANAANAVYDPARGRLLLRLAGFAGTNGATFLGFGAAAANGALVLDYSGGALRLRIYNNVGALIGTATCGAVSAANHDYIIEWDAAVGKASIIEGATVLGSFAGVWTPAAAGPNPVYVGCDSAGANAARCHVNCLFGYTY